MERTIEVIKEEIRVLENERKQLMDLVQRLSRTTITDVQHKVIEQWIAQQKENNVNL